MGRDISSRRCGGSWACTHYRRLVDRMSENRNVKEHHGHEESDLAIVGIPAKPGPLIVDLGSQGLLGDAGEERGDVDSLTSGTELFVEVEGLVLEQIDGHLGGRLGMVHVIRALVHVLVNPSIACIALSSERNIVEKCLI